MILFFGEIWHALRQRIWSRSKGRLQRESKNDSQANNYSSKPITILKPLSIEGIPQLQHLNFVFNLQDSPSHKESEDFVSMAEGEKHQNTEGRHDLMVQWLQNLKGSQEKNKTDQTSFILESEKKINEKISKMEEMIKGYARWKTSWIINRSLFSQM